VCVCESVFVCVCVCLCACVCVWERERERGREEKGGYERESIVKVNVDKNSKQDIAFYAER